MSKCFEEERIEVPDLPPIVDDHDEDQRRYSENWDTNFTTVDRYVNYKLKILRNDMYINPTWEEISHMRDCQTRGAVDAAFRSLITKYWG